MTRVPSSLTGPVGARLLGGLLAVAGLALLVVGVLALSGGDGTPPGAAPAPTAGEPTVAPGSGSSPGPAATGTATATGTAPSVTTAPATTSPSSTAPSIPATTSPTTSPTARPSPPPRAPLTVLNNSTQPGLGDRAAAAAQRRGWRVAQVGNFAGRLPVTTVYYTPGNAAEERAARQFAAEFPQVERVFPRYAGLPPTPAGIVLVVTRDWSG